MRTDGWTVQEFDGGDAASAALWNELVTRSGGSIVQRAEFVFCCARILGQPGMRPAVCRRQGMVCAAALLHWRWGVPEVFVESQMPLGAWVQLPGESFETLARMLLQRVPFGLRLGVPQLDARFVPRPADDERIATLEYIDTPWLTIQGSYADYWAARGKNLRANMRKQRDKLAAQGTTTRMEILAAPADIARGVSDYAALESKGWKAAGGTAISEEHPQTRFYREMLDLFARMDQSFIYRYFFGENLVACELCLCDGKEFVILKTTYDESTSPLSPASLLRQEMFEGLFDRSLTGRVEFYGPLKEWHTRWTPDSRQIYHANFHAHPIASSVFQRIRSVRKSRVTADG